MSEQLRKRSRLLRVRIVQHRIAMVKVAEAAGEAASLRNVGIRITALRDRLGFDPGVMAGQSMQAVCEMGDRLESAAQGLCQPIAQAEAALEERQAVRLSAHVREQGAARLRDSAASRASRAFELRADADQPFRKHPSTGDRSC
jgi:hypothetical protein